MFSFQNSKAMTAGEGGIAVTNDAELAARLRSLVNCGRRAEGGWFEHFEAATNARMTGLQAALLLGQLERLGDQLRLRRNNAAALKDAVTAKGCDFQKVPDGASSRTLYLLPGRIEENVFGFTRDEFVKAMEGEGIPCRPFYPHPLYKNPMYETLPKRVEACPEAERACEECFWLPQSVLMGGKEDALDVARAIEKIYRISKPATLRTQ